MHKTTKLDKNAYLDTLARETQEGIWMTELGIFKKKQQLADKKKLLAGIDQKLIGKKYGSANEGKTEKKFIEEKIVKLETDLKESESLIDSFKYDLDLIEKYRKQ